MALSEFANYELGEAFWGIISSMVVRDGIPYSKTGDFDIVSKKWRNLADKENKTAEEIQKIDKDYKQEIIDLADSASVYIAASIGKNECQFNLEDYINFMNLIDKYIIPTEKNEKEEYDKKIKIQFKKLANHGENFGDDLIDNKDLAAYIYALDLKSERDENNNFKGFILNGKITPMNYAMAYKELKEDDDNMFSFKLRQAYKNLFSE